MLTLVASIAEPLSTHDSIDAVASLTRSLQEDEGQDADAGLDVGVALTALFFLVWNLACAALVVHPIASILRGECDASCISLLCPHWVVGIIMPLFIGYSSFGLVGAIVFGLIDLLIPYSIWITCFARKPRRGANRQSASEGNNEITSVEVGDGGSHPEEIFIIKHVLPASCEETGLSPEGKTTSIILSYRSTNPKTDIFVPEVSTGPGFNGSGRSRRVHPFCGAAEIDIRHPSEDALSNDTPAWTQSTRMCTICLEEYKIGETIAWSRNPACYHAFHHACIKEWIQTNKQCPICRSDYIVSDIESGADSGDR